MSKRRNHDAAFKARVALEALKGERKPLQKATPANDGCSCPICCAAGVILFRSTVVGRRSKNIWT